MPIRKHERSPSPSPEGPSPKRQRTEQSDQAASLLQSLSAELHFKVIESIRGDTFADTAIANYRSTSKIGNDVVRKSGLVEHHLSNREEFVAACTDKLGSASLTVGENISDAELARMSVTEIHDRAYVISAGLRFKGTEKTREFIAAVGNISNLEYRAHFITAMGPHVKHWDEENRSKFVDCALALSAEATDTQTRLQIDCALPNGHEDLSRAQRVERNRLRRETDDAAYYPHHYEHRKNETDTRSLDELGRQADALVEETPSSGHRASHAERMYWVTRKLVGKLETIDRSREGWKAVREGRSRTEAR